MRQEKIDEPDVFCSKCREKVVIDADRDNFIVNPCGCEFNRGWNECYNFNTDKWGDGTWTAKEIIKKWLKDHNYDGLCNPEEECGCFLDDLAPCEMSPLECRPGIRVRMDDGAEGYDACVLPD